MFDRKEYISDSAWNRFLDASKNFSTPNIFIDLRTIKKNFLQLKDLFPYAYIYYAVKSNPGVPVIKLLRDLGSNFDIASRYELDMVLDLGVSPDKLSYGNTIKKAADIKYFYEKGVRMLPRTLRKTLRTLPARHRVPAYMLESSWKTHLLRTGL